MVKMGEESPDKINARELEGAKEDKNKLVLIRELSSENAGTRLWLYSVSDTARCQTWNMGQKPGNQNYSQS